MKRKHQIDFENIMDGIIAGSGVRRILVNATPGSGKSSIPLIAGKLIAAKLADKLCWICPRTALQDQGARAFVDPFFRRMFEHKHSIRTSTNEYNPCRATDGFTTTYQAIGVDTARLVAREIKSRRYIVVLDEFHHVEYRGVWHSALEEIIQHAAFVVLITGTLERGDGKKIAFIDYKQESGPSGPIWRPVLEAPGMATVTYTRTDALKEKAVIPLKFITLDGHAKWQDSSGNTVQVDKLSRAYGDYAAAAIYTALNTEFAADLMNAALSHWRQYRLARPRSQMLVVCACYASSREVCNIPAIRPMFI